MSILEDVDLASKTGFLRDRASVCRRLPRDANRHSKREGCHGTAHRGRADRRLLYRPAVFQTGLQVLGIHPATQPAVAHSAARHVERKTKARARPRGVEVRVGEKIRIQNLWELQG